MEIAAQLEITDTIFSAGETTAKKKKTSAPHRLPGQNCQKKSCQSMKQKL